MNYIKYLIIITLLISALSLQVIHTDSDPFFTDIDTIESPVLIVDKNDGSILHANEAASTFYGYEHNTLTAMKIQDIADIEDGSTFAEYLATTDENNILMHKAANGDTVYVEITASDVEYDGQIASLVIISDMTDLQAVLSRGRILIIALVGLSVLFLTLGVSALYILTQNNRMLRKTKKRYQTMYQVRRAFNDGLEDLVYLKDEKLNYIFVNKAVEAFYDRSAEQIIGRDDYYLTEKTFADLRRATDLKVLESNKRNIEHVFYKDKVYLTTKFPVPLENGLIGVGAYIQDVTESYYLKAESEKILERQETLLDTVQTTYETNEQQYQKVLEGCLKLTDSAMGFVVYTDKTMSDFRTLARLGCKEDCNCEQILEKSINEPVFKELLSKENKTIYDNNANLSDTPNSIDRFVCVPVTSKGQLLALVFTANKKAPYNKQDINHLELLIGGAFYVFQNKRITDAIYKERMRYYQILQTINEGIITINKNMILNYANDLALDILNGEKDAIIRKPLEDIIEITSLDQTITNPLDKVMRDNVAVQFKGKLKNLLNQHESTEGSIQLNPIIVRDKLNGVVIMIKKSA